MKRIAFLLCAVACLGFAGAVSAKTIKDKTLVEGSYAGVKTIRVVQSILEVRIEKTSDAKTAVKCYVEQMTVSPDDYNIVARQSGSVLEIREEFPSLGKNRHYGYSFRGNNKGYIRISVPAGVKVVSVRNSSGATYVSGVSGLDSLNVSGVSGNVRLSDVSAVSLSAKASSGSVTIEKAGGRDLKASSVSGGISVSAADFKTVDASSSSGSVTLSGTPGAQTVNVKSVSGDIDVSRLVASGDFQVKTSSGSIALSSCKASGKYEVQSVSGDIVIAKAFSADKLSLRTSSGTISITDTQARTFDAGSVSGDMRVRTSDFSSVSARTSSGDVSMYLGKQLGTLDIKTVSGDVDLYFKGELKDNDYRLNSVGGSFSIEGLNIQAKRGLEFNPGKGSTKVTVVTSSGDIRIGKW